jgi:hypothetical protein
MGLLEWVGLGYAALLVPATLIAASLCKIAKLSGQHDEDDRREIRTAGETAERDTWIAQPGVLQRGAIASASAVERG